MGDGIEVWLECMVKECHEEGEAYQFGECFIVLCDKDKKRLDDGYKVFVYGDLEIERIQYITEWFQGKHI